MRLPTTLLALPALFLLASAQSAYEEPAPSSTPASAPESAVESVSAVPLPSPIATVTVEPCANSSIPDGTGTGGVLPTETGTWVMPTGPSRTEGVEYDGGAVRESVLGGMMVVVLVGMGVLV